MIYLEKIVSSLVPLVLLEVMSLTGWVDRGEMEGTSSPSTFVHVYLLLPSKKISEWWLGESQCIPEELEKMDRLSSLGPLVCKPFRFLVLVKAARLQILPSLVCI